ncbi:MAG: hypothetical protein ACU0BF_08225 [Paracoccaceae bacterium]
MTKTKLFLAASAVALTSTSAFAGGMAEPMIMPAPAPIMIDPAPAGSLGSLGGAAGVLLPLAIVAAVVAASSDTTTGE